MKIERTKNATRNIFFGGLLKMYQLIVPFIMRTLMIYLLGPGYAGLNGLFTSVLQVLNLAELGVGSAMVFSMYKPISEDDKDTICALMLLYRSYYRVIGLVIAIIGSILIPFIPNLIKADLPSDMNIYILYIMNLVATVLSYWLFAYRNSILAAHQRNDVTSKVALVTDTIKYILQIGVLYLFRNYYLYIIIILITQIINNIVTALISQKMYPDYNPKGKLDRNEIRVINGRIRDLFTSKIGMVVVNSADAIVVSSFMGLTSLAIYQNYFFPVNAVMGLVTVIYQACTAGIGNSIITETEEKNYYDFKKFTFLITYISSLCSTCFLVLMQPFMEIWMGKRLMLGYPFVVCLVAYFYISEINRLLNLYKDAAGLWHEDRFRPIITAITNLVMNIIMVQYWGLYGVILSTVLSMVIVGMPWILHNLFSVLFSRKLLTDYLKVISKYLLISVFVIGTSCLLMIRIKGNLWVEMIIRLVLSVLVVNLLFYIIYRKKQEYTDVMDLIRKMTKGKVSLNKIGIK